MKKMDESKKEFQKKVLKHRLIEYRGIYLMMIPIFVFFILFKYYPMYGIVVSFKHYLPRKGILGSEWVGLKHFEAIFAAPQFMRAFRNTLIISVLKIVFCFPIPLMMALFLNEMRLKSVRSSVQCLIYLPNFISWVIIGELARIIFATGDGIINNFIFMLGGEKKEFLTNPDWFYFILIISIIYFITCYFKCSFS